MRVYVLNVELIKANEIFRRIKNSAFRLLGINFKIHHGPGENPPACFVNKSYTCSCIISEKKKPSVKIKRGIIGYEGVGTQNYAIIVFGARAKRLFIPSFWLILEKPRGGGGGGGGVLLLAGYISLLTIRNSEVFCTWMRKGETTFFSVTDKLVFGSRVEILGSIPIRAQQHAVETKNVKIQLRVNN